tara:strand:+ start:1660 stop:1923 length:264 start_codon:yes stop_codon:yes gene_type:complete
VIRLVVYTAGDDCMQCRLTKQMLDAAGLAFHEVNLAEPSNAAAHAFVTRDLGYLSVPILVVDEGRHWVGFRPDLISDLACRLNEAES